MFWHFFLFELKLRLKSFSSYIFFLMVAALPFFSVSVRDFGPIPNGKVFLNGPYAFLLISTFVSAYGAILMAAVFGPAILRDFQQDTYQLLFTKPVSKFVYLGGRWAGSLATMLVVFTGTICGAALGTVMPWAVKTRLMRSDFGSYWHTFFGLTAVQVFFLGCLFFCVAALTRRIVVVYLQGVALFA